MSLMKRDAAKRNNCSTRTSRNPGPPAIPTRHPGPANTEYGAVSDPANKQLAEWLKKMGCPLELSEEELKSLNTPSMRPVWSHITQYVRPAHEVQLIRKNLLLARLKRQSGQAIQQTTGVRVGSIGQLKQLQNIAETQQRIIEVQEELEEMDQSLQSEIKTHLVLKSEIQYTRESIEEIEMKTALLQLNLRKVVSDTSKLDEEIDKVNMLIVDTSPKTFQEKKHDIMTVLGVLAKSVPSSDLLDNEHMIKEVVSKTIKFTADIIYYAICLASKKLYNSLRRYKANLNMSDSNKSLHKHLRDLRVKIVNNEFELQSCCKVNMEESVTLDTEKESLASLLEDICDENNTSLENEDGENVPAVEFLNAVVANTISKKKLEKVQEFIEALETECSEFENVKQLACGLGEKETDLNKEAEKKAEEISELYCLITSNKETDLRNKILRTCGEQASKFFAENKNTNYANEDVFGASEDLIWKEIEVFVNTPIVAFTRDWEEPSYTMKHNILMRELAKKPGLLALLFSSEPVNVFKNVIEKKYWSQTLAEHYNAL